MLLPCTRELRLEDPKRQQGRPLGGPGFVGIFIQEGIGFRLYKPEGRKNSRTRPYARAKTDYRFWGFGAALKPNAIPKIQQLKP